MDGNLNRRSSELVDGWTTGHPRVQVDEAWALGFSG